MNLPTESKSGHAITAVIHECKFCNVVSVDRAGRPKRCNNDHCVTQWWNLILLPKTQQDVIRKELMA